MKKQITKNKMENKKAQEEAVGFVLIIVIVSVIFLILLSIMLRHPSSSSLQSTKYQQLLSSIMEINSNCVYTSDELKIAELIGNCIDQKICSDGRNSCDVLNNTISDMLNTVLNPGPDASIKGYDFSIVYQSDSNSAPQSIIHLAKAQCNTNSSTLTADYPLTHYPGNFTSTLSVCT